MTTTAAKPDTTTAGQPPAVDRPEHPLHALTTFELRGYRRQIENAITFFDKQDPSFRYEMTCKPRSMTC